MAFTVMDTTTLQAGNYTTPRDLTRERFQRRIHLRVWTGAGYAQLTASRGAHGTGYRVSSKFPQAAPVSGSSRVEPVLPAPTLRELRLALVCYGGASLAVYMAGVVQQIHKLVRASHAFSSDDTSNPFNCHGAASEKAYWDVLRDLKDCSGFSTRVVVDVISGTSAGGINGVFLALGLSLDVALDPLRGLWMREGDMRVLVPGWRWIPWPARLAFRGVRSVMPRSSVRGLLDGDHMSVKLADAVDGMVRESAGSSLVPPGESLDLFVTATDLEGEVRQFSLAERIVTDREHRRVLHFRHDPPLGSDFEAGAERAGLTELAFAARATSCFPAAFEPVSVRSFARVTGRRIDPVRLRSLTGRAFEPDQWLADGGIRDNKPFGYAIAAIPTKPAAGEVDRWLVYLDPSSMTESPAPAHPTSTVLHTLGRVAAATLSEPIIDELRQIAEHNELLESMQQVMSRQFRQATMDETLARLVGAALERDGGDVTHLAATLSQARRSYERRVGDALGAAGDPYLRLRAASLAKRLSALLAQGHGFPGRGPEADGLEAVLRACLFERLDRSPGAFSEGSQLRRLDAPFVERALRFALAGAQELYGAGADRAAVGEVVASLHHALRRARTLLGPGLLARLADNCAPSILGRAAVENLTAHTPGSDPIEASRAVVGGVLAWFGDLLSAPEEHTPSIDPAPNRTPTAIRDVLSAVELQALTSIVRAGRPLGKETQAGLLARYLGYGLWDAAILPMTALTGIEELSTIRVAKLGPDRTSVLSPVPREIAGTRLHNFGAFLTRTGREQDFALGQLDAAEQLVRLLADHRNASGNARKPRPEHVTSVLQAVVKDERAASGSSLTPNAAALLTRVEHALNTLQRDTSAPHGQEAENASDPDNHATH